MVRDGPRHPPNVSYAPPRNWRAGMLDACAASMRAIPQTAAMLVLAGCSSQPPRHAETAPTCGITAATVLSGDGIGALRVGTTVDELRAACHVIHDSTLAHGNEGMPERRISVAVATDTVEAIVVNDSIRRIEVTTPRLRTADSLGVGTTARALRDANATLAVGDRGVFALVPTHCGLSFHLAGVRPDQASWTVISDDAIVDRVLVYGCATAG